MDPLGPVFSALQANAWVYCLLVGQAPWGMRIPASGSAQFHSVRSGSCWIVADGVDPIELRAGDLAVVCQGDEHFVTDDPGGEWVDLLDVIDPTVSSDRLVFNVGEEGRRTDLVCGGFQLIRNGPDPLDDLPPVVVLRSGSTHPRTLDALLETAKFEIDSPRLGSTAVLSSLGVLVLVETLRAVADDLPAGHRGLLAGIQDDRVAKALAAIHEHPDRAWSLQSLAQEANTSKSTLTSEFRRLMGTTVGTYLNAWRMTNASALLETSDLSLRQIALASGYRSEAAFSRAFKRHHGLPPGAYRSTNSTDPVDRSRLPPLFEAAMRERREQPL